MNLKAKKKELVVKFNLNRPRLAALKEELDKLLTEQVEIQAQLRFIKEIEDEPKAVEKTKKS